MSHHGARSPMGMDTKDINSSRRQEERLHMQAMGRYLLLIVEGGKYQAEGFRACQALQAASEFAVLTGHHLLCVTSPGLRFLPLLKWQVALEGVILVQRYASCPCACSAPANSSRRSQGPDAGLAVCHLWQQSLFHTGATCASQLAATQLALAPADAAHARRKEALVELLVLAPRMTVGMPGLLRKQPLIAPASLPYHTAALTCQVRQRSDATTSPARVVSARTGLFTTTPSKQQHL